jgi:hypothetical protein
MYLLTIMNNGNLVTLKNHEDILVLSDIFETEMDQYSQDDNGAVLTDDGYAKVYRTNPNSVDAEVIWQYNFDGEESVADATNRLKSAAF